MNQSYYAPKTIEEAKAEVKGIADQRVQNLVISLDKVRHAATCQVAPHRSIVVVPQRM